MKICVTGGGGYIGSALSIRLAQQGHDVTVIDHFYHGHDTIKPLTKLGIAVWDIKLFQDYPFLLKDKDVIFHLAAIAGSKACDEAGVDIVWDYNVENTKRLVDCLDSELLILTSTSAIYGEPSLYTETKLAGETRVLNYTNSIAIRLPTIFGFSPCMRENILVHDLVESAVNNGYIVLWDRNSIRTWMSLQDCVSGLITLMENPYLHIGEIENIDGNFFSKNAIARKIQTITNCEIFYSDRKGKYVQNFYEVSLPRFNYNEEILTTTKELVKYYEGTKHSSSIDWSK